MKNGYFKTTYRKIFFTCTNNNKNIQKHLYTQQIICLNWLKFLISFRVLQSLVGRVQI